MCQWIKLTKEDSTNVWVNLELISRLSIIPANSPSPQLTDVSGVFQVIETPEEILGKNNI